MKILQVIPYFTPKRGGDVYVCYNVSKSLANLGHEVTIISTDFEANEEFVNSARNSGIRVILFHCVLNFSLFLFSPDMKNWLEKNIQNFDVIHLHDLRTYQNIICSKIASRYGIEYLIQAHGDLPFINKIILKFVFDTFWGKKILKQAHSVIALSESEVSHYKKMNVEKNKIFNIPNSLEISDYETLPKKGTFKEKYMISPNKKIILYLGRIHKNKGINHLIDAFYILLSQDQNIVLVIAGPDEGYLSVLKNQIKSLNIEENVLFTEYISGINKLSAYVDADVLVYPGKGEIFGLVPFEAIMCNTPVIVSNDSGCGELINKAECGFLINYGDVTDLSEKINFIRSNPDLAEKKVIAGKEYVLRNLTWEKNTSQLLEVYQDCKKHIKYDSVKKLNLEIRVCVHAVEMGPSKENVIAGGVPNSIIRLVKVLNTHIKSIIITNDRKYRECNIKTENFSFPNTETHFILIKGKYASLKYYFEYLLKVSILISKLNIKEKIDIIHGHSGHLVLAIVTNISSVITTVPGVHTVYCPINLKNKMNFIYKYLLRNIKVIIAISENVKLSLITIGIPKEKIRIIPPIIDFSVSKWKGNRNFVRKELSVRENEFTILYLGNLTKTKGIDLILDSLKILKTKNFDFKFVSGIELTHTGTDKRKKAIINKIEEFNLKGNIIELGLVRNVSDLMNACDILVAPFQNTYDVADYPLVILEAMAVGIPVITTAVGGISEIITDNENGIIIDFDDPNDLADHIIYLMNNLQARNRIGKKATIFVREKFSADKITEMTQNVYREILNE